MASKIKIVDGYQVKQVLAEKAGELNAFGWNKVKNSTRTIKKKVFVNVRRKIALSRTPGLKSIELKYDKWSKKKIKKNPIGGIFAFLFMLIFFAVALVGLYIGLNDDIIGGKAYEKSIAIYNAAIETNMIALKDFEGLSELEPCTYDADTKEVKETDGYKAFIKQYIAYSFGGFINNYSYTDGDTVYKLKADEDEAKISDFAKKYLSQLEDLGYIAEGAKAVDYDSSVAYDETKEIYSVKAGMLAVVDGYVDAYARTMLQKYVGYKPLVMFIGIPLIAGAAGLILFIICLIAFIRVCGAKKRIAKREEIIAECVKEAKELVYGIKVKNRDLMTRTERKMFDMQSMIVRAIHQVSDDEEDDD